MPSDSKSDSSKSASSRDRLPFEPAKSKKPSEKKGEKKAPAPVAKAEKKAATPAAKDNVAKESKNKAERKQNRPAAKASGVPEVVSRRMIRRMALFCGIPTFLGMSTFFVSYLLVTKELVNLPNVAVVLVSMGFFGLGVLGLTYGVLSASWDEEHPGSTLGWTEFTTNFGRMREGWRSPDKKS